MSLVSSKQFGIWRIVFGFYLTFYFLRLFPYAIEVYSRAGAFPRSFENSGQLYPSWLLNLDSASQAQAIVAACALASFMIMAGWARRFAALVLWLLLMWLFNRNSYANSPDYPFTNWLVFILIGLPTGEEFSLAKKNPKWTMPPLYYWGAWTVLSCGYLVAGITKLMHANAGWVDGSALYYVLTTDNTRMAWYGTFFDKLSEIYFWPLTWATVFFQLFAPAFALFPRARLGWWLAITSLQSGILLFINLPQVTIGMFLFHGFLWNSQWTEFFRRRVLNKTSRIYFLNLISLR